VPRFSGPQQNLQGLDGGNRFISVQTLGAQHIFTSRAIGTPVAGFGVGHTFVHFGSVFAGLRTR
jgi:hypothetical protein